MHFFFFHHLCKAVFLSSTFFKWQMFPLSIPSLSFHLLFLACAVDCASSPTFLIFLSFPSVSSFSVFLFPSASLASYMTPTSCSIQFPMPTAYIAGLQSSFCTHSGVAPPLNSPSTCMLLSCLPLMCAGFAYLQVWGCIPTYRTFTFAQLPSSSQTRIWSLSFCLTNRIF